MEAQVYVFFLFFCVVPIVRHPPPPSSQFLLWVADGAPVEHAGEGCPVRLLLSGLLGPQLRQERSDEVVSWGQVGGSRHIPVINEGDARTEIIRVQPREGGQVSCDGAEIRQFHLPL